LAPGWPSWLHAFFFLILFFFIFWFVYNFFVWAPNEFKPISKIL
jgi:hypothetical protein